MISFRRSAENIHEALTMVKNDDAIKLLELQLEYTYAAGQESCQRQRPALRIGIGLIIGAIGIAVVAWAAPYL